MYIHCQVSITSRVDTADLTDASTTGHGGDSARYLHLFKSGPQRRVGMFGERVQVGAHKAAEQHWVLRHNGESAAQEFERKSKDIHSIDEDLSYRYNVN